MKARHACDAAAITELPYISPRAPDPLPSIKTIQAAPLFDKIATTSITKLSDKYIVKYGPQVNSLEGENMIFVKQNTNIPVPEVYAIFHEAEEGFTYIIMEYIPGETLASAWPKLDDTSKCQISSILHAYTEELRALPAPGYFGSIGRRPLLESMFWTGRGRTSLSGPFDSEGQLNDAMIQKYLLFGGPASKADYYRRILPRIFCHHQPVFTHADFQPKNFIVNADPQGGYTVTLIDWEKSGWLPSYWEFGMAMSAYHYRDDWDKWLVRILKPFHTEYPYLRMMYLDIWS